MLYFVTIEIANKLKELGFKEKCLAHYLDNTLLYNREYDVIDQAPFQYTDLLYCYNNENNIIVDAPTIYQVLEWLRSKYNIHIQPYSTKKDTWYYDVFRISEDKTQEIFLHGYPYETFEESAMEAINFVINDNEIIGE